MDNGSCQCDLSLGGEDEQSCVADCVNTPGSHECVCNAGYMLAVDSRSCVGMYRGWVGWFHLG